MDPLLRLTMVSIYGEANVKRLEAITPPVAEPVNIPDQAEAARFAAEIERDAALGDDANWPHL